MLPTETKQLLAGPASYNIRNSLRFRASASAYLNRTPSVAGTSNKIMTISAWVKRGSSTGTDQVMFGAYNAVNTDQFRFSSADQLEVDFQDTGAGQLLTTQVFRDYSAWYHLVLAIDTTQATASNRAKLYVNGVQVTAFATASYPAQNTAVNFSSNVACTIGRYTNTAVRYFDGYMAEVNLIDGQALLPSSFGFYDPYTGVWMPQRYTGTYTGNSYYLPFINQSSSTFAATFNGSTQYLVTNSVGNALALSNSDFTVEYWMNTTTATNGATLCCAGSGTVSYDGLFGYITGGALVLYLSSTGGSWDIASNLNVISAITTGRWYHIAISRSGSTWRVFVDGTQVNTITSSASLYQSSNQFSLARAQGTGYFTGLLSNVRVVKGTALYTSNFTPPIQPLTAVTNTQLLTLQNSTIIDNSANNISITNNGSVAMSAATPFTQPDLTADYSGLGNNWTPNNISLSSGVTYDSMIDVPTNWPDGGNGRGNYCVLNPIDKGTVVTINNANIGGTQSSLSAQSCRSTIALPTSGLWYWECTNLGGNNSFGIQNASASLSTYVGGDANGWSYFIDGTKYNNNTATAYGSSYTTNDVIGVAFDATNNALYFGKQTGGTGSIVWQNSGVPTSGASKTGAAFTSFSGTLFPSISTSSVSTVTFAVNFGQRPFSSPPPAGYLPLNTQNLVTPTILNGANYMAATLYTGGNGSSVTVINSTNTTTGKTFQPDFVWIKDRTTAGTDNTLWDVVRGNGARLYSNSTAAEGAMGQLTSLNPNGFTVGYGASQVNYLTDSYVGWQWNAGTGSSTIPTGGSITPTGASINVSAGFSIIKYPIGASGGGTVPHGLGAVPSFIINKVTNRTENWRCYHISIGAANAVYLNLTTASTADSVWGSTTPTASVFTIGNGYFTNGDTCVAYLWTPIAGYSSMGSYTGNGSADGPFIYTGFRPRWLLRKRIDTTAYWILFDTSRNPYNIVGEDLYPNDTLAGNNDFTMDILSNGFKIRGIGANINASGGTYIYVAFAENPFKVSRAR